MSERVCVVAGVGAGNGVAFSRKFAVEGYRVAMLARSEGALREWEAEIAGAKGYPVDVTNAEEVRETFERIRSELGPVDVYVHNAGNAVFGSFLELNPDAYEEAWRTNCFSLVLCGREATQDMQKRGGGSIVVVGATASLRGAASFAAFASAKAAQRILAQSMARTLGPQRIHVSYLVIDGVIDMPRTRVFFKDRPEEFFLKPAEIAETVYHLANQPASAWTFEADVRPFGEKW